MIEVLKNCLQHDINILCLNLFLLLLIPKCWKKLAYEE